MMALLALVLVLPSCGNSGAEAVNQKIDNKEELTQEDYTTMVNYLSEAVEFVEKQVNENGAKIDEIDGMMEEKYPYCETFFKALGTAKDLDEANKQKVTDILGKLITISLSQQK